MKGTQIAPGDTRPGRRIWSWPERVAYWVYGFVVGPFLTKLPDGTVQGSMTRWAVAAFTAAEIVRLVAVPQMPLGWPDAFVVFFILFALPIDNALSRAQPKDVLELLGKPFARAGEAIDQGAQVTTTLTQDITPAAPTGPGPEGQESE
jgi:hypothetical protein